MTNEMYKWTFNILTFIENFCWRMEDSKEGRGMRRGYCLEGKSLSIKTSGIEALYRVTFLLCLVLALGPA